MSDFRKKIQNKYNREVNPRFREKHWDTFISYWNSKKKKSRRGYFLFPLLAIVLISFLFILLNRNSGIVPDKNLLVENQTIRAENHPGTNSDTRDQKVNIINDETNEQILNVDKLISPNRSISNDIKRNDNNFNFSAYGTNLEKSPTIYSKLTHQIPESELFGTKNLLELDRSLTGTSLTLLPLTISPIHHSAVSLRQPVMKPISVDLSNERLGKFSILVYAGLSMPSHVETFEEQAQQFGGVLRYDIKDRLRLRINATFSSISFISKKINPRLGIKKIETPSNAVDFSMAVVESFNANVAIGLDYSFLKTPSWQSYFGLSYGFSKELAKEIDYEFIGFNLNDNQEDILIPDTKIDKFFVPHILHFEAGVEFSTPVIGVNFFLGYPVQLNKNKVEMLRQFQVNFGVSRKF